LGGRHSTLAATCVHARKPIKLDSTNNFAKYQSHHGNRDGTELSTDLIESMANIDIPHALRRCDRCDGEAQKDEPDLNRLVELSATMQVCQLPPCRQLPCLAQVAGYRAFAAIERWAYRMLFAVITPPPAKQHHRPAAAWIEQFETDDLARTGFKHGGAPAIWHFADAYTMRFSTMQRFP
jgi:hypothetical protein